MAGAASNGVNGSHANGAPSSAAAKYDLPSHFIGGTHLGVASPGKVKDFVAAHGGHTVITNVSYFSLSPPDDVGFLQGSEMQQTRILRPSIG
jgi:hypothetical protein